MVRPGFELTTSRSVDRRSPNWANQAAVTDFNWNFNFIYMKETKPVVHIIYLSVL